MSAINSVHDLFLKVDGVVVRISSPGGDALASDLMWREVRIPCYATPWAMRAMYVVWQSCVPSLFSSFSSNGWGRNKVEITTVSRMFRHVVCQFNSIVFAFQR